MDHCENTINILNTIIKKIDIYGRRYDADWHCNSIAVIIPIMVRIFRDPLAVLKKLNVPFKYIGELSAWLLVLTNDSSVEKLDFNVRWYHFSIADYKIFESSRQPLLRVSAERCSGKIQEFSSLFLTKNKLGSQTIYVSLLCPDDIDPSTLVLVDLKRLHPQLYPYQSLEINEFDVSRLSNLKSVIAVMRPNEHQGYLFESPSQFSLLDCPPTMFPTENSLPWPCVKTGMLYAKKSFPNSQIHTVLASTTPIEFPSAILSIISTRLFLREEFYLSRIGQMTEIEPILYIKEITLALLALKPDCVILCRDLDTDHISLVIVPHSFHQDLLSGCPLMKLTVLEPTSSQSISIPERFIDYPLHLLEYNKSGITFFFDYLRSLTNGKFSTHNSYMEHTVYFPLPFPRRDDMFKELSMMRNYEQLTNRTFGVVSQKLPDPEGNLIALKELGGKLHSQKDFKAASFCYILGALCMESGYIDSKKSIVIDAVAKCHSNLAMTQLHGGGSMYLAIQSCKAASSLLPLWHKPWYLLGLCLERNGEMKKAIDALRKALFLAPSCIATRAALTRVLA